MNRISAETRFRVYKEIRLGVGYLGRLYTDEIFPEDDYSGHAFRLLLSGKF